MASSESLLDERHEIAGTFERLLVDIVNDTTGQVDALLQDEADQDDIIAAIVIMFDDIRDDYFESYEDIAEPIIERINQDGFFDEPSDEALDLLEALKEQHIAVLDAMEADWISRVIQNANGIIIPGVESEDLFDYISRTSAEHINEIIGNTDIYHRVMSDVLTGAMIVSAGGFILNERSDEWVYTYIGPKDNRNRPHCARFVGQSLTRREINQISPAQLILAGNDPAVTPSYITTPCRHNWELSSK